MFQFPPFAYLAVYMSFTHVGCPIRKSPDQWPFAPTRSLSQLITSFFASESQGIRHAPLLTFFMTRFKEPYLSYGASHQQSQSFFKNLLLLLKLSHNMSKIVFSLVFHTWSAGPSRVLVGFSGFATVAKWWRITDSNR